MQQFNSENDTPTTIGVKWFLRPGPAIGETDSDTEISGGSLPGWFDYCTDTRTSVKFVLRPIDDLTFALDEHSERPSSALIKTMPFNCTVSVSPSAVRHPVRLIVPALTVVRNARRRIDMYPIGRNKRRCPVSFPNVRSEEHNHLSFLTRVPSHR
jgi:hypothetical protein